MKIKKQISIFLAVLILVSNVGFAFNVHYCGGSISSITLDSVTSVSSLQKTKGCCQKMASQKESCCKNKKIVVQKKTIDKIFKTFSFQFDTPFLLPQCQFIVSETVPGFKNNMSISYCCDANAPPFYKLYSQYLLYDKV